MSDTELTFPEQKVLDVLRNDPFVRKLLECTRELIYAHFKDWERIDVKNGKILFTNDNAAVAYAGLSAVLGLVDDPRIDGTVKIGGVELSMGALTELQEAFRKPVDDT